MIFGLGVWRHLDPILQGRGQDMLFGRGGYSPESWRARWREPTVGVWGLCPSGVQGQSPWLGAKPPESRSNFTIKWTISRSRFDYLTLWGLHISSIIAYLLYNYVANAKKKQLGGKVNLLESCFVGWIIHVWRYLWHLGDLDLRSPLSSPLLSGLNLKVTHGSKFTFTHENVLFSAVDAVDWLQSETEVEKNSCGALPENAGGNDTVPISVWRVGGRHCTKCYCCSW